MSRRGWNLRRGTPQRADYDRAIHDKWLEKIGHVPPEPEQVEPDPDGNPDERPTREEKQRLGWALREVRRQHWAVPTLDSDGRLVPRSLPETYICEWELLDDVLAEVPDYLALGWQVFETEIGFLVSGPGRLPQLIDPSEIVSVLDESSIPVPAGVGPEPVQVEMIDGVALVAPNGADRPE
jgi:hypothetical protein